MKELKNYVCGCA